MSKKSVLLVLMLLAASLLTSALHIRRVEADGAIYIMPDGSVQGTTSIQTTDNVTYFFTSNIDGYVEIDRDNMILDGRGVWLTGNWGTAAGIWVNGWMDNRRTNVTIQNLNVDDHYYSIFLRFASNCTISKCNATSAHIGLDRSPNNVIIGNNAPGLFTMSSDNNVICGNTMNSGISVDGSNNKVYHNNLPLATNHDPSLTSFWDNGYPSGGNFWTHYNGTDLKSGPYQNETGSDGIGDTPYTVDGNNTDHYPLMHPFIPLSGDLNQDGKVDVYDAILAAKAFGSTPSDKNWNSTADLNGDGQVDIFDLIMLARDFGKIYHP